MAKKGVNLLATQSEVHQRQAWQVTWIGLVVNVVLFAGKLIAGLVGHSQAVVADAVHTLSDCSTDVAVLVGMPFWSAPADEGHPHGHKRIETLVTLVIGSVLAAVGVGIAVDALAGLKQKDTAAPGWIAVAAAFASIVAKEGMYRWTVAVGRRAKSSALIANAWHHRSDAFSSIPVLIAVGIARLVPSLSYLDHVGALIVSLFIVGAAWTICWPALKQLVDAGAPEKDRQIIRSIALETRGVERVHAIRTRYAGSALQVDLHIMVDANLTVREGHEISEQVKQRLLNDGPDLVDVVVHLEPCRVAGNAMKVLFLCVGNSCRSQTAEGWAHKLKEDVIEAHSAGVQPRAVDPRAVQVMAEDGVDISRQRSKHLKDLSDLDFDWAITVCDAAHEACPVFPKKTRMFHVNFEDPARLAANARTEEEALGHYRRVRDEIRIFVEQLPDILTEVAPAGRRG